MSLLLCGVMLFSLCFPAAFAEAGTQGSGQVIADAGGSPLFGGVILQTKERRVANDYIPGFNPVLYIHCKIAATTANSDD